MSANALLIVLLVVACATQPVVRREQASEVAVREAADARREPVEPAGRLHEEAAVYRGPLMSFEYPGTWQLTAETADALMLDRDGVSMSIRVYAVGDRGCVVEDVIDLLAPRDDGDEGMTEAAAELAVSIASTKPIAQRWIGERVVEKHGVCMDFVYEDDPKPTDAVLIVTIGGTAEAVAALGEDAARIASGLRLPKWRVGFAI